MSANSWAITALDYTKRTLGIGMANQPTRVAETGGLSRTYVNRVRSTEGRWVRGAGNRWTFQESGVRNPLVGTTRQRIAQIAERAMAYRAGNCGEHAAVAFEYLAEKACLCGYISYASCIAPGDHAFIVIDRQAVAGDNTITVGPNAAICDPWGGYACTGAELVAEAGVNLSTWPGTTGADVQRVQHYIMHYGIRLVHETMSALLDLRML